MEKKTGANKENKVIITSTGGEINADGYGFHMLYPKGIILPDWSSAYHPYRLDDSKKEQERIGIKFKEMIDELYNKYYKKVESKRIYSELDPYGEEDWNE